MSAGSVATTLAFAAILLGIAAIIDWHRIQISREDENLVPSAVPRPAQQIQWPLLASCSTPAWPLTVGHAHRAMQIHLECVIERCGCKRAAQRTLVEAGRMHPRVEYR